jgi:hypothetical protein
VGLDFTGAGHLPKVGGGSGGDPNELPRQRRGTTPQMHGRYPDYDVLEQADHWDEVTREVVLARVHEVPPLRFFGEQEAATLDALCDVLTAQDADPRIPVLNYIDEKLHDGKLDGFQFEDLPDDREVWRAVAAGLDAAARERGADAGFRALDAHSRHDVVKRLADGELESGPLADLNVKRAFSVVMRGVLEAFYSHPWAWNEIGFGGPAYPRGYSRFGSPHLQSAERESWEGQEAFDRDPVSGRVEPPPA